MVFMHTEATEQGGKPRTLLDYLAKFAELVMVTLATLMVSLVTYQVFQRYVLHYTPPWSEELAVYLMIWFGMIAMAVGVRRNSHMALRYFADKCRSRFNRSLTYVPNMSPFSIYATVFTIRDNHGRAHHPPAVSRDGNACRLRLPGSAGQHGADYPLHRRKLLVKEIEERQGQ